MNTGSPVGREAAVLVGGAADGLRMRVTDRPRTIQVTYPCELEAPSNGVRAEALHIYRRDFRVKSEPLRYGFDGASP
ncbi:hypothetical protein OH809_07760 [Streptomyces sp. NBC_00873]|uniref:hypothetical protein n=1 Tax=unclassified Streptomyces TaxID=2593676 RepID=UPI00386E92F0|nr:hypothetical protein OH809_07760 [Streptomyces sp. NBC_00873]WTA47370.1 hypothetical protein OH821_36045 [Streptomyces sp. NBC_00842]